MASGCLLIPALSLFCKTDKAELAVHHVGTAIPREVVVASLSGLTAVAQSYKRCFGSIFDPMEFSLWPTHAVFPLSHIVSDMLFCQTGQNQQSFVFAKFI